MKMFIYLLNNVYQYATNINNAMSKSNNTNGLNLTDYKLPSGALKRIAKRMGFSEAYVSFVKSGKRNNLEVSEAIVYEIQKYMKKQKALESKIKSL